MASLDPRVGRTVGIAEEVFAQYVEPMAPPPPKRRVAGLGGEVLAQAVSRIGVGRRGGGMDAAADDPLVLAVGAEHLGQLREGMLFVPEEQAVAPRADAFMVWVLRMTSPRMWRRAMQRRAGWAAPRLDDVLGG
ncbi:hypothetical protein ACFVXE_11820 [Streptomyces sp. NPDC058231]|uniref:hypothetical protein n=1 Tax=Streptomyces sp. NPDC058231 TaxID=3346392 RepID=UPI0036E48F58